MNTNGQRHLSVIGAPTSVGAYGPGQEKAPAAFRRHGLLPALETVGWHVTDRGDQPITEWRKDPVNPGANNVDLVASIARGVADTVAEALADGHTALVLGGDCTIELGTVAGAIRDGSSVALAYIDLDADLKTPYTGDGVLDWMGVAHLLAVPGAQPQLTTLAAKEPMLKAADVRLFGVKNITDSEHAIIQERGIHLEKLDTVKDHLQQVADRTREWAASYDRLLVHVDIDVLDNEKFPIAEMTDLRGGLDLTALTELLTNLCANPNLAALTLAEINPAHAPDENHSFDQLIASLISALTGR
ncbi:MAG: arginase family protein [Ornithinimicrobium sp.]